MDINEIKSNVKMKNFCFLECSVVRNEEINRGNLSIDLKKSINKTTDGDYSVVLTLTINKEGNDLHIKVVASAIFSCDDDSDFVDSIMETNTVAIMFPFIRSQVSLLTTQPGMNPIILPPINTAKFK